MSNKRKSKVDTFANTYVRLRKGKQLSKVKKLVGTPEKMMKTFEADEIQVLARNGVYRSKGGGKCQRWRIKKSINKIQGNKASESNAPSIGTTEASRMLSEAELHTSICAFLDIQPEMHKDPIDFAIAVLKKLSVNEAILFETLLRIYPTKGINGLINQLAIYPAIEMSNTGVSTISQAFETPVGSYAITIEKL